jgi:two-component system, LytTR family, sensor kinase
MFAVSAGLILLLSFLQRSPVFTEGHITGFILVMFQVELFTWLGIRFFRSLPGESGKDVTRKILRRFIWFYLTCFVAAAIIFTLVMAGLFLWHGDSLSGLFPHLIHQELRGWLIGTNFGLLGGTLIFFYIQWNDAMKREQKLREENLIFQNQTLKNQVNPHFLFNSLNTLSSLVGTNPELAEKFTVRLADIYRYILENGSTDSVVLREELEFVQDYFYLHKIRDEDKISLAIDVPDTDGYRILPVSLQLLIENALKHNMATRSNPLEIHLYTEEDVMVVTNNRQPMASLPPSAGTGLKNLAERIRLTSGKELIIENNREAFTVKIPLIR